MWPDHTILPLRGLDEESDRFFFDCLREKMMEVR